MVSRSPASTSTGTASFDRRCHDGFLRAGARSLQARHEPLDGVLQPLGSEGAIRGERGEQRLLQPQVEELAQALVTDELRGLEVLLPPGLPLAVVV